MKVAIYGRTIKLKQFKEFFNSFTATLEQYNVEYIALDSYQNFLEKEYEIDCAACTKNDLISSNFDALISLGGDGTMLDTLALVGDSGLKVMGVNLGRLGFLADIQIEEIDTAIKALIAEDYIIEKRTVLEVISDDKEIQEFPFALNDFVVQKRDTASMITVKTSLNNHFLNNYWADGLIVATPTGSSGYNMSCGGPLLFPGAQAFVITPIAAHNLTVRPAVIPDSDVLNIEIGSRGFHVLVTLDSRSFKIPSKTKLQIKKAAFKFNMIRLKDSTYMNTIRNKLLWGKDVRN